MHADVSVHSAAVDADESWGAIGSLSVMVAALPAQEELYFAFTAARRRGRTAHVRPGLSPGVYPFTVMNL